MNVIALVVAVLVALIALKFAIWSISKVVKIIFYGIVMLSIATAGGVLWWMYFAH